MFLSPFSLCASLCRDVLLCTNYPNRSLLYDQRGISVPKHNIRDFLLTLQMTFCKMSRRSYQILIAAIDEHKGE
jgi:hypothetical protein